MSLIEDLRKDAEDEGFRAALRGESVFRFEQSYKSTPTLWAAFKLGHVKGEKELLRQKEDKKDER